MNIMKNLKLTIVLTLGKFKCIWLNQYMSFGISILTYDNCNTDRSLLGIFWQQHDNRLRISLLFINYIFYF